ncbi:E3 ubiquitin-protein ligase hyd [Symbiodinium microadriaticum]|uniref:HECT-type E3 ubiquitin transferase n=1 Tax=Symbiodinium microadriaticum TaxID=2951 RepID=A0A1Q9D0J8_SYMMI|nr:E3 ubiquitin-protein ligase hyd [Symbiodinium microadriaticum]
MLCPRGHATTSEGRKLGLFSRRYCDVCGEKVSRRGGVYHECAAGCDFRVCSICKKEAEKSNYFVEPCTFTFPGGLGPFSIQRTSLEGSDLFRSDPRSRGGSWILRDNFFQRGGRSLRRCWQALQENGVALELPQKGTGIAVDLSPIAPTKLCSEVRRASRIPDVPGVLVAWMYALQIEWHIILGDSEREEDGTAADWSFLTVGGFVLLQEDENSQLKVLCANSVSFHPSGPMQFSAPQPWCSEWTRKLAEAGRFRKVTVQKWASAGARYLCWICPEEKLLRPGARHGGFVFLFHELDEEDTSGRDRFFEVVGAPVTSEARTLELLSQIPKRSSQPEVLQSSALPFRVVGEVLPASSSKHMEDLRQRCFKAASDGRWSLLAHILTEFPAVAQAQNEEGQTVLHKIAAGRPKTRRATELLRLIHSQGGNLEAQDTSGQKAYNLGDQIFRAQACEIWGLVPDLFADPEVWFDYWDANKDGHLSPEELVPALAAAYQVGELGRQWIESYVNTHYREMAALDPNALLTKSAFLGNEGLLHKLQSSEEFISLRGQEDSPGKKMPALFKTEGRKKPTEADKEAVKKFSKALEDLRAKHGWNRAGNAAPSHARLLEVSGPFPGGDSDPEHRMKAAKQMLAWSFAKTTARSGKEWMHGFKIQFTGDDVGIDHGGLTKRWVQEVGHALWGSEDFFDTKASGSFFKHDSTTDMRIHAFHVKAESLYRWVGRFLAYSLYQGCVLDCALSPWALRWLMRVSETQAALPPILAAVAGDWQREGEDSRIATISGRVLLSHADENGLPPQIALQVSESGDTLQADFDGESLTASLAGGRLRWSDGDVWVRCIDCPIPRHAALPVWDDSSQGDDQLLEDLATMDPAFANSLWRVRYEMPDEDLQWLTFSYAGRELVPGGDDIEVSPENKAEYVRLCCKAALLYSSQKALQAFSDGFFDVLPPSLFYGAPADVFQWLLLGDAQISDVQIEKLEQVLVPDGLVPKHLKDTKELQTSLAWLFKIIRRGDSKFRSRLLEFWTGSERLPLGGVEAIEPKPRLQVMISQEKPLFSANFMWEVQLPNNSWSAYSPEISGSLNNTLEAGLRMLELQVGRNMYVIDIRAKVQVNRRTGDRRKVRRRKIDMAADDRTEMAVVKRIESWPATRLPEGHTCGNELWIPLCDSEEDLAMTAGLHGLRHWLLLSRSVFEQLSASSSSIADVVRSSADSEENATHSVESSSGKSSQYNASKLGNATRDALAKLKNSNVSKLTFSEEDCEDTWQPEWSSKSPAENCEEWARDGEWGALSSAASMKVACKGDWAQENCMATCGCKAGEAMGAVLSMQLDKAIHEAVRNLGYSSAKDAELQNLLDDMEPAAKRSLMHVLRCGCNGGRQSAQLNETLQLIDPDHYDDIIEVLSFVGMDFHTKLDLSQDILSINATLDGIKPGLHDEILNAVNAARNGWPRKEHRGNLLAMTSCVAETFCSLKKMAFHAAATLRPSRQNLPTKDEPNEFVIQASPESREAYRERQGEDARGFHFKVSLPVERVVSFIESRAQVEIEDPRTLSLVIARLAFSWCPGRDPAAPMKKVASRTTGSRECKGSKDYRLLDFHAGEVTNEGGALVAASVDRDGKTRLPKFGTKYVNGTGGAEVAVKVSQLVFHEFRENGDVIEYSICGRGSFVWKDSYQL